MASVNRGNQILSFDYRQEARAKLFNRLYSQIIPYGIYSGANLTRSSNVLISITPDVDTPTVVLIKDQGLSDLNILTRVEATSSIEINLDDGSNAGYANSAKPYLVFRFEWVDVENNFMDIRAVQFSNDPAETDEAKILPTDIILGKVLFEEETLGSGNYIIKSTDSFDTTRRTNAFIPDSSSAFRELRVQSSETSTKKVYVSSGYINTSSGRKQVSGGDYPAATNISDTTAQGRIDIVYVDEDGSIQIEEGVPSASPVSPPYLNRKVLAEINRGASRTTILGPDIRQVNVTRQGMISSDQFLIKNNDDYYTEDSLGRVTIENAFTEIYELYASILAAPGVSDDTVKDYHIDWGTGTGQVSAVDIPIANLGANFTATEVEAALDELADNLEITNSNLTAHINTDANTTLVHGIEIITEIV